MLEEQSQAGLIDLFYGDESSVSEEGYVPPHVVPSQPLLWSMNWKYYLVSPHLNLAKQLWKELKVSWLRPEDY